MGSQRQVILCYRRLSMVKNAMDLVSPTRQKEVVEAMVVGVHQFIPEWYEDIEGHSSGRTSDREGWQKLLAQLGRDDVVGVAAYDISRLYRNVQEFLGLVNELNARSLRLLVVKENVDTKSAVGMAILTILMAMYQLESDLASERMKANIDYKRRSMGRHWGPAPFGCMRDADKNLIPDPKTWDSLRYLYELFVTGDYTYDDLVRLLNDGHHPWYTRQGDIRPWQQHDVRRVLCSWRLYAGMVTIGRAKDGPVEVIDGAHDPILSPDLCARVGAELGHRRRPMAQQGKESYLLTPFAFCGNCGAELDGNTRNGTRYYKHSLTKGVCPEVRVKADVLEGEVLPLLAGLAESPELQRILYEEVVMLRSMEDPRAQEIQTQIQELIVQRERLTDAMVSGNITGNDYRPRREKLERQMAELQESLPPSSADELEATMWATLDMLRGVPEMEPRRQKEVVLQLLERVEVQSGHITRIVPRAGARHFF